MGADWSRSDWRGKPRVQMPDYPGSGRAGGGGAEARLLPAAGLRRRGAAAEGASSPRWRRGGRSCLQGGDCAESFAEFSADNIRDTFKVMLQMAVVLTFGAKCPVVKIGRMAGQFAKPRSSPTEVVGGVELPSYRGDIVNGFEPTPEARVPDPARMLQAYTQAAATLNLVRAFSQGGYADIDRVHSWTLDFTAGQAGYEQYHKLANRISDALDFMTAAGVSAETADTLHRVDFYTSPRGAAARVRGGALPHRLDHRAAGGGLGAHDLDRRPHAAAGRGARRVRPGGAEPDRAEVRADDHRGRPLAADRQAQPAGTRRGG